MLNSLLLSSFISFGQEIINSTSVDLKKTRNVFQTVNNEKKEVSLFVSDKIKVKAIQLNEKMQIIDSISTERPDKKTYDNMIGYNVKNNNTRLYWSSNDYENIFSQLYDFNSRKIITKQFSLTLKNEKVLQKFSENDNFYILTVVKKSNNLKLHIFDKDDNYVVKTVDLEGFHYFLSSNARSDLNGVLSENLLPFEMPYTLQNIDTENPTSITDGAKKRKCYFGNKQITITLDANIDYTQVIIIDLENFIAKEKMVKKQYLSGDRAFFNSNSFYFDNKLYQIKSSSDLLYFTIKDLDDNLLKQYTANAANPINFKNSEIYQEGGAFGGKRTLESTTQFIRKINNLNSGIACYHVGQNTLLTLGGVSELKQSGTQAALGSFGLIGAVAGSLIEYYNPTMASFNSYSNRKVVKIEGLFDNENNHIEGNLNPLAFDKIRIFFDDNTDVSSQTLFKMDAYYLGYFDNKTKEYIIRKFAD